MIFKHLNKYLFCIFAVFLCISCTTQYEKLGVFEGIKKEFVGVDFNKKTSLFVFSDIDCSTCIYYIQGTRKKISPNTQILGLYLNVNPKAKFGYQDLLDETKNEIKWVSMKDRKLFGLISQCTQAGASPFLVEIENNKIISVEPLVDIIKKQDK